ncbi:MAG: amino acid ABC transporter permease [Ruminococcaceae bacterium]|nr:amino acid ABC transporter permease [Oscillospiraceae bacterium]
MELLQSIFTYDNTMFLLEGLRTTLFFAGSSILLSIFFGMILGLLRNYDRGILGKFAAIYIELVRNTPLILWILAIRFLVPIPANYSGICSLTIFETAVIAEIIRGGLNAIPLGQFEAAHAQGFTFFQTLRYIVMPQCFHNIVPSLLSQVITTVKDSSFLWAVAIEEFTGKGMILMGRFASSSQVFLLFASMALIYFLINFSLSLIVRSQSGKKPKLAPAVC